MWEALPGAADTALRTARTPFAGLAFDAAGPDQAAALIAARPPSAPFGYVTTPNAEYLHLRRASPLYAGVVEDAWMATLDSRVIRRIMGWAGIDLPLATGNAIVERLFAGLVQPSDRINLVGGTPEIAALLQARFHLSHVAQHVPPMGFIHQPAAVTEAIAFVAANPARYTFIIMGPPHSDALARMIRADGRSTGLGLCVGSAITALLGLSRPPPPWMERHGLVWLNRLLREPRRLWRRYLGRSMRGVFIALGEAARRRLPAR